MKNAKLVGIVMVLVSCHWAIAQPSNINVTPATLSVSIGATATFRVTSSGASPFTYQWWLTNTLGDNAIDGVANPSALRNILNLTNVQVASAGGYYVVVTDANTLSATSGVATLTVDPTFTKITEGPIVNDRLTTWYGYWGDYDNDGRLDVLVNGNTGQWRLYHNDGGTMFSTVTNGVMGEYSLRAMYGVWADPDSDDDLDVFAGVFADVSTMNMFWNNGDGHFTRVPFGPVPDSRGAPGNAWGDYDRDGFVDVFVASVDEGASALFHNNGDGTLTVVTNTMSIPSDTVQVTCTVDYDNDGDLDLVPVRWGGQPTRFYRNDGRGTFTEATPEPIRSDGIFSLSAAWGDFDNDGDLDVIFGGYENRKERFYVNNGDGTFTRWAGQPALFEPSAGAGSWLGWGDFDNDGCLDLAVTKGDAPIRLWRNRGDGSFAQVLTGSLVNETGTFNQSGCWVDFNQDGNLDLFVATLNGGVDKLYMGNDNGNHWLEVKPKGTASNRQAVGARVFATATVSGKVIRQMRVITASDSDESLIAHFGLGHATNIDLVRIEWPSGNVQELTDVAPDQLLTVTEPTLITPARPSVSLNGSVTLTRAVVSGATYQWQFDGADLIGQANRTLNLTNIVAHQEGRYSVVVSNASTLVTNFVYLHVDTEFTKITEGPIVNDRFDTWNGYWGDYDNDGRLDVQTIGLTGQWRLYHNDGGTMFSTVTNGVMGEYNLRANWGIWADPDNDDDLDVFALGQSVGASYMFLNDGGGDFTRVPVDWWVVMGNPGAWGDYDQDGFIDAFFATAEGGINALLHNNGDGTFTRVTNSILNRADTVQVTCSVDYDNDGDLDLVPVRWGGQPTRFYRNDGRGTFTEATPEPIRSELTYSLSAAWGDFDNDGDLDVIFGGYAGTRERFYINNGDGTFTRWAGQPALFEPSAGPGSWLGWGDFDNDGYLDLAVTKYDLPIRLWRNRGDGSFAQVLTGSLVNESGSPNQSGCWVDFNQDGNLDLFVATINGGVDKLYMGNGNGNHWLEVKPKGTASNRQAVGARIFAKAPVGGKVIRQMRVITASDSDESLIAHFGLGNATNVTTLRIEWPSGTVQEFPNVAADQILNVWEPPAMSAAVRADGACELSIKAEPNRGWHIKASSDLLTWQTLLTLTNTTSSFQFTDIAAAGMACRFYWVENE